MAGESTKDVKVRLLADPKDYEAGMIRAGKSTRVAQREAYKMEQAQKKAHRAMTEAGKGFMLAGAAMAVGLGYAVHAAIQWESAWAGVTKTVEGSDAELTALEDQLRTMAQTLPASHVEIAKVAEAAGQLGIATKDVAAFTKTMIDMGVTTNMTSEEAAEGIAKMMNIMASAPEDVDRLASTIVELGNKGATTEKDIMAMALRIAGAGHQIGMSEAEVLAFSAALSNVGIEAEAGGSAISTIFVKIADAVSNGGETLEAFAAVAGMTASDFQVAFRTNAAGAIDSVVNGLSRLSAEGENTFQVMADLGIKNIRERDAMLRLAGATGLLTNQLGMANKEWDENSALIEEAHKRYQTTESKIQIAQNKITDFAISLGSTLLPIVADIVDILGSLGDMFNAMPDWLQTVIGSVGALAAVILLIGGAALVAVPKIAAFNAALGASTNRGVVAFRNGLRGAAGFMAGPWGAAIGIGLTALMIWGASAAQAAADVKALTETLDEQTGAVTKNTRVWMANKIFEDSGGMFGNDMIDRLKEAKIEFSDFVDAALKGGKAYKKMMKEIQDARTEGLISDSDAIGMTNQLRLYRETAKEGTDLWKLLNKEKKNSETSSKDLSAAERQLAESLGLTNDEAKKMSDSISDLSDEISAFIEDTFAVDRAQDALQEQLEKTKKAAMENGGALEGNSEAARENRRNMEGLVEKTAELAEAEYKATGSKKAASKVIQDQINWIKKNGEAMGMTKEEVEDYVRALETIKSHYDTEVRVKYIVTGKSLKNKLKDMPVPGARADGGWVHGPGGPRSDSIPMWLSNGEYVVNAKQAQKNKGLLEFLNSGGSAASLHTKSAPVSPGGSGKAGLNIEQFNLSARDDHFDMREVENYFKNRGFNV